MWRTDQIVVTDPSAPALLVSRWTFNTEEACDAAGSRWTSEVAERQGLARASVYRGLDEPMLLELSHWSDSVARDGYIQTSGDVAPGLGALANATCNWWHRCDGAYRTFVRDRGQTPRCLVVVRQPLVRADRTPAQEWIDLVIAALEGQAPDGLCAATFFIASDAAVALNLAEWTSAEAHRAALTKAHFGQYGSIGDTEAWRKARSYPGITADHEVRRYGLIATVEP